VISPSSERRPPRPAIAHGQQVGALPFGGDAQTRLAHEGRREVEAQRLAVEAGEHDLAAGRQAGDQRCRGCAASPLTS
jgi:hypothetical protein